MGKCIWFGILIKIWSTFCGSLQGCELCQEMACCQDSVFCQYHKCYLDLIDLYIIEWFISCQSSRSHQRYQGAYNWVVFVQFKLKKEVVLIIFLKHGSVLGPWHLINSPFFVVVGLGYFIICLFWGCLWFLFCFACWGFVVGLFKKDL